MLKRLKRAILGMSKRVRAFELVAGGSWRGARLLILCYHGISLDDEHLWDPELYIPPELFEERLQLLRNGDYHVLPLDEALERLYAKSLPSRSVAITFDDGYADFSLKAVPLLSAYQCPATVYLTTFYCEYNRPVFDVICSYLLWKGRGQIVSGDGLVENGRALDLQTVQGRKGALDAIRGSALRGAWSADRKDAAAAELAARLGVDFDDIRRRRILHLMNPDEVRALPHDLVDVQLHTHRHRTPRNFAQFGHEIEENRSRLEVLTGGMSTREPAHFCYPSGVHEPEFLPWLRTLRVRSATTTMPGIASVDSEPLLLPRFVDTCAVSALEFEAWTTGVAALLPRRRHDPPREAHGRSASDEVIGPNIA